MKEHTNYILTAIVILLIVFIVSLIFINKDYFTNQKRLIWFHHIHKSGGSSFVDLARKNGEKMYYKGDNNGNPVLEKDQKIDQKFIDDTIENGTTFIATEWNFEPVNDDKITYVTMLRNPLERLISHIAHLRRNGRQEHIGQLVNLFGNTGTKVLAGYGINDEINISEKDYDSASKHLDKFDIVLNLDNFEPNKIEKLGFKNKHLSSKNFGTSKSTIGAKQELKNWLGPNYEQILLNNYIYWDNKLYENYTNSNPNNIIICGIVRDSAKNVEKNLNSLYELGKHFKKFQIIVIENDSKDGTDKIVKKWGETHENTTVISKHLDENDMNLDQPDKTLKQPFSNRRFQKMAYVRNIYMSEMEKIDWFGNPDTLVAIADLDLHEIPTENILKGLKTNIDWNLLCANGIERNVCNDKKLKLWGFPTSDICTFKHNNTPGKYYDSLAIRFNEDQEMSFADLKIKGDEFRKEQLKNHEIKAWKLFNNVNDEPLEVKSCFGGFAMYKSQELKGLRYNGGDCEHISINNNIQNKKFTLPGMVVYYD